MHILEWIQLDRHLPYTGQANGRPTKDRLAIACAFVAKAVLNLGTTRALIDRLNVGCMLRRKSGSKSVKNPSASEWSQDPKNPLWWLLFLTAWRGFISLAAA